MGLFDIFSNLFKPPTPEEQLRRKRLDLEERKMEYTLRLERELRRSDPDPLRVDKLKQFIEECNRELLLLPSKKE